MFFSDFVAPPRQFPFPKALLFTGLLEGNFHPSLPETLIC